MKYIFFTIVIVLNFAVTSTHADEGWVLWERFEIYGATQWTVIAEEITLEQCKKQKNEQVKLTEKGLKRASGSTVIKGGTVSSWPSSYNYRCLPGLARVAVEHCVKEVCSKHGGGCTFDAYVSSERIVKITGGDSDRWQFEKCMDQKSGM